MTALNWGISLVCPVFVISLITCIINCHQYLAQLKRDGTCDGTCYKLSWEGFKQIPQLISMGLCSITARWQAIRYSTKNIFQNFCRWNRLRIHTHLLCKNSYLFHTISFICYPFPTLCLLTWEVVCGIFF